MLLSFSDFSGDNFEPAQSVQKWRKRYPLDEMLRGVSDMEISSTNALNDLIVTNYSQFLTLVSTRLGRVGSSVAGMVDGETIDSNANACVLADSVRSLLGEKKMLEMESYTLEILIRLGDRVMAIRKKIPCDLDISEISIIQLLPIPGELNRIELFLKSLGELEIDRVLIISLSEDIQSARKNLIVIFLDLLKKEISISVSSQKIINLHAALEQLGQSNLAEETCCEQIFGKRLLSWGEELAVNQELEFFLSRIKEESDRLINYKDSLCSKIASKLLKRGAEIVQTNAPGIFIPQLASIESFVKNYKIWKNILSVKSGMWRLSIFFALVQKFAIENSRSIESAESALKRIWVGLFIDRFHFPKYLEISSLMFRELLKNLDSISSLRRAGEFACNEAQGIFLEHAIPEAHEKVKLVVQVISSEFENRSNSLLAVKSSSIAELLFPAIENAKQVSIVYKMTSKSAPTRQSAYVDLAGRTLSTALGDNADHMLIEAVFDKAFDRFELAIDTSERLDRSDIQFRIDICEFCEIFAKLLPHERAEIVRARGKNLIDNFFS